MRWRRRGARTARRSRRRDDPAPRRDAQQANGSAWESPPSVEGTLHPEFRALGERPGRAIRRREMIFCSGPARLRAGGPVRGAEPKGIGAATARSTHATEPVKRKVCSRRRLQDTARCRARRQREPPPPGAPIPNPCGRREHRAYLHPALFMGAGGVILLRGKRTVPDRARRCVMCRKGWTTSVPAVAQSTYACGAVERGASTIFTLRPSSVRSFTRVCRMVASSCSA